MFFYPLHPRGARGALGVLRQPNITCSTTDQAIPAKHQSALQLGANT